MTPPVNLNLNVRGMSPSATVSINEASNELIRQGRRIYKLGLGQSPFPVPEPVVEALRDNAHQKDYLPVRGLKELREAVACYHQRVDGVSIDPSRVLIGPGSKELMFLVQLAFYGDLIVPRPCWVSYAPQARIIGRTVHFVPTTFEGQWRIHPEELENLCASDPYRPRLLILNYPGNPDGGSYGGGELEELAEVARKYRVVLLSDEIYGPLTHEREHKSIARFYPEGTIISSGLSKWCGAGGWRLGTFAFPQQLDWLLEAMAALASETYTSTSAPIQWAAVRAFVGCEEIDAYLVQARRLLRALGNWIVARLRDVGARIHDPVGAFYLFPDFSPLRERLAARGIETDRDLCAKCLEQTGVAFLPGQVFGMSPDQLTARLAYVDFDGGSALAAASALSTEHALDEPFLRAHCRSVIEGVDELCRWLKID
jgi:aspartate aminotransferase